MLRRPGPRQDRAELRQRHRQAGGKAIGRAEPRQHPVALGQTAQRPALGHHRQDQIVGQERGDPPPLLAQAVTPVARALRRDHKRRRRAVAAGPVHPKLDRVETVLKQVFHLLAGDLIADAVAQTRGQIERKERRRLARHYGDEGAAWGRRIAAVHPPDIRRCPRLAARHGNVIL